MGVHATVATIHYKTFEEREDAFRERVAAIVPRRYAGPRVFWEDFNRIRLDSVANSPLGPTAFITSNPRDCLAFGSPWQVLTAATLGQRSGSISASLSPERVARDFDLFSQLHQAVRTLSGGETVKLALAKVRLMVHRTHRLVISSPFSWLSKANRHHFQAVLDHYQQQHIPVELLALEGENDDTPVSQADTAAIRATPAPECRLELRNLTISLSTPLSELNGTTQYATCEAANIVMVSPCLMVGENGQGKSLIAKTLAGAIRYEGYARVRTQGKSGQVRLLFQDVIHQTLLRSFPTMVAPTGRDPQRAQKAIKLFEAIMATYAQLSGGPISPPHGNQRSSDPATEFRSLLEIKAVLVAIRLVQRPAAIILDEPDWGLARRVAIAFVCAVVRVAHERETAVILISHKPWWRGLVRTTIQVWKEPCRLPQAESQFEIKLRHE